MRRVAAVVTVVVVLVLVGVGYVLTKRHQRQRESRAAFVEARATLKAAGIALRNLFHDPLRMSVATFDRPEAKASVPLVEQED